MQIIAIAKHFKKLKMVSHASLLVVIISVKSYRSCSFGLAKYKLTKELSQTIKFKYFFPTDQPPLMFASGDIVFISGKFIVENLEPCFTIAYSTIVNSDNPNREFNTSDVPISMPHCLYSVMVNHEPKKVANFIHFGVETVEYNSVTGKSDVKIDMTIIYPFESPRFKYLGELGSNIKLRSSYFVSGLFKFSKSGKIMIEATDIDYLKTSTISISGTEISRTTNTPSIIDIIDDDIDSVSTQQPQRQHELFEISANATDNSTGIDRSHDTKKYHTTVEDYQSDEIKSVNEDDNEKDTNLVNIDQQSQEIEEEEELQPKKRKRNVREKKNQVSDNMDLQEIEEGEEEL
ncbi:11893_t:CDS:1 [Gigaspora margarita]|uniref:11893_t:CDS:1 n=1 Tax=Gigaspora margarita TaxID=4874 RepID=A0ABN7W9E1_GIGMA|nr:11893_t:CDS:1 [Gigaspora margarita]